MLLANDDKRIKLEPPEWSVNRTQVVRVRKKIMMIYGKPLREYFNFWPKWLWALNIFALAFGLWIILFL